MVSIIGVREVVCITLLISLIGLTFVFWEVFDPKNSYSISDKTWTTTSAMLWIIGLIFIFILLKPEPEEENNPGQVENSDESARSRPRLAPISYLRTLSLPSYEMAMSKNNKKTEETPPPQFHELKDFPLHTESVTTIDEHL